MGIDIEGYKDVLGIWITNNESASFWQEVLTDLKMRGVEDILLTVSDDLPGLSVRFNLFSLDLSDRYVLFIN